MEFLETKKVRITKFERKEKIMKKIVDNIRKAIKRFIKSYKTSMKLYGEALLRGGSYGCV